VANKTKPNKTDIEHIKAKTQTYFAARPEVLFAYLFGSVAAEKDLGLVKGQRFYYLFDFGHSC